MFLDRWVELEQTQGKHSPADTKDNKDGQHQQQLNSTAKLQESMQIIYIYFFCFLKNDKPIRTLN